jgi:hypothetical protein
MPKHLWILCLVATLAACRTAEEKRRDAGYLPRRSELDQAKYDAAVKRKEILIGMKKSEVLQAWGQPMKRDRTTFRGQRVDRWMWAFSEIYFDREGYVVGWHTAGR